MTRSCEEMIAALQAFEPTNDGADNVHWLNETLEGFAGLARCDDVAQALFALLERHPDADFGTPGPLVRALEGLPAYAGLLDDSLRRQPTELGAWMANRLLNSPLPQADRTAWLRRLTEVASHHKAGKSVRESAIRFLDFQASRPGRAG